VVSDLPSPGKSLTDMARAHPADRTLQNLLGALSATLELCGRLPVYQYEATTDGHAACATAFAALAVAERESCNALLACLQRHLDETSAQRITSTERSA
jgi:hypothetical protein